MSNRDDSVFENLRSSGEVTTWPDDELSMSRHTLQHGSHASSRRTDWPTVMYLALNRAGIGRSNLFNTLGRATRDTTMRSFGHETNRVAEGR